MSCRFPGASTIDELWYNLENGIDCCKELSKEECEKSGQPENIVNNPAFIRRAAILEKPDWFDASFFNYSPQEARLSDPQHRIFLECCWEAMEHAGCEPGESSINTGVYCGCGLNNYLLKYISNKGKNIESLLDFQTIILNDKDYLASHVSYKMGLTGPAITMQSACSSSLVAVASACSSLLTGQCDLALAGGVSLQWPRGRGYLYKEGEIFSADGVVRTFDRSANGTILGEGAGVVLLKRAEDAIADRDFIWAIIRGCAVNNDGNAKTGYTAPSIKGQSSVIELAQLLSDVNADQISYVETHGTGTHLGDPIEVAGLTEAFGRSTEKKQFCALGSLKTQIGHLDVAAGIAGLIKVALMLHYKKLIPVLHFSEPNPELRIEKTPFYICDKLMEWNPECGTRFAGISSFGIGGTNAHAILQEAPRRVPSNIKHSWYILPFSAKTESSLHLMLTRMVNHFQNHPDCEIADAAYTLQTGRNQFSNRAAVIVKDQQSFAEAVSTQDTYLKVLGKTDKTSRPVAFLFPGQGAQYNGMALKLYSDIPLFRQSIDECLVQFKKYMDNDKYQKVKNSILSPESDDSINDTEIAQPAIFMVEYSLAKLWISWGVQPVAFIGHSLGEITAAMFSGVLSLPDACYLVVARGRLMQSTPSGSMTVVLAEEKKVTELIGNDIDISVINAPSVTVVSGEPGKIEKFESIAASHGIECRRLHTNRAFHSRLMDGVLESFDSVVKQIKLSAPKLPCISNVTGTWMTAEEAVSPSYWTNHIRMPVKFSAGLTTLANHKPYIFLEVGPGNTLVTLLKQHQWDNSKDVLSAVSLRHPKQTIDDTAFLFKNLSQLWIYGVNIDWSGFHAGETLSRVPLPTYPFERQQYNILSDDHEKTNKKKNNKRKQLFPLNIIGKNGLKAEKKLKTVEERLADIWKELLGVDSVSYDASFFDLGGHSLLAAHLFERIKIEFEKNLPLSVLIKSPTISGITKYLCDERDSNVSWSSLVPIKKNGGKPPLYLVHGAEGNVLLYRPLSRYLDTDQPLYGLQAQGLDGSGEFIEHIEIMAEKYMKEIVAQQPEGPYYIGGYCMGGVVAFEIGRQLESAGHKVGLVLLLESYNAHGINMSEKMHNRLAGYHAFQNILYHSGNLISSYKHGNSEFIREKAAIAKFRLAATMKRITTQTKNIFHRASEKVPVYKALSKVNDHAYFLYSPRICSFDIAVFRPQRQFTGYNDHYAGWKNWTTGSIDVSVIPVLPRGMLVEPFVKLLAAEVNKCLKKASEK